MHGLPGGKEDKTRRVKSFSAFFSINFFTSDYQSSECTRALLFWCCARRRLFFHATNWFRDRTRIEHKKEVLNVPLLLEKTRILTQNTNRHTNSQRPTHVQRCRRWCSVCLLVGGG